MQNPYLSLSHTTRIVGRQRYTQLQYVYDQVHQHIPTSTTEFYICTYVMKKLRHMMENQIYIYGGKSNMQSRIYRAIAIKIIY